MKLSSVFKVFGAAALIAGLTPYRVTKDEETGEKKYRALFWEAASGPKDAGMEKEMTFHVGFFSPTVKDEEEPHFFADELTVEYTQSESEADSGAEAEEEAPAEEAPVEISEEAVETAVENVDEEAAEPVAEAEEDMEASPED